MDGNFVNEHLWMQNLEDDVAISDEHGYMVTSGPYKEHLKAATDTREVYKPWYIFRAISQ